MDDTDDLDLAAAAYHEAGHALCAHLLGGRVAHVTLDSDDDVHMGRTTVEWRHRDDAERRRCSALVALAGPMAEARWRGDATMPDPSTWSGDWDEVRLALEAEASAAEQPALLQRWLREVASQFGDAGVWESLCRLADAIEAHGTLDDVLLDDLL